MLFLPLLFVFSGLYMAFSFSPSNFSIQKTTTIIVPRHVSMCFNSVHIFYLKIREVSSQMITFKPAIQITPSCVTTAYRTNFSIHHFHIKPNVMFTEESRRDSRLMPMLGLNALYCLNRLYHIDYSCRFRHFVALSTLNTLEMLPASHDLKANDVYV